MFMGSICSARRKLPNLSRTGGPVGGGGGNGGCFGCSYLFDAYDVFGCDVDAYRVSFGCSSWSSSSLGKAKFLICGSFLLSNELSQKEICNCLILMESLNSELSYVSFGNIIFHRPSESFSFAANFFSLQKKKQIHKQRKIFGEKPR